MPLSRTVEVEQAQAEAVALAHLRERAGAANPVPPDAAIMAPVAPGPVEAGTAPDQERDGNDEQHDADAADEQPQRVLHEPVDVLGGPAPERDEPVHAAVHAGSAHFV